MHICIQLRIGKIFAFDNVLNDWQTIDKLNTSKQRCLSSSLLNSFNTLEPIFITSIALEYA